jgi:hypothetical protein
VTLQSTIFWEEAPCSLVEVSRRFDSNVLSPSSESKSKTRKQQASRYFASLDYPAILKMETAFFSETSINFYQTIRRNIAEDNIVKTNNKFIY